MFKKSNFHPSPRSARPRNPSSASHNFAEQLLGAAVFSFLCGTVLILLLLCLFAFLLAHSPLPLTLVRPLACAAAAVGVATSGFVFARKVHRQYLLCGLACGVFYACCQLLAAFLLQGGDFWGNGSITLSLVALMSGLFGGAFAAVRAVS